MQTCETCPYFVPRFPKATPDTDSSGECHHSPPDTVFESTPWPDVDTSEFCGQHPANIAEAQVFIATLMDQMAAPVIS